MGALGKGLELGVLLVTLKNHHKMQPAETLRALEIAVAMGLVKRS
jgi:hypothetical protein